MRYRALACDYDGTLASGGRVEGEVVESLRRLEGAGGKLILVTGRELSELQGLFPELGLFDRVVAENGAVVYRPEGGEERVLAGPPPGALLDDLGRRGVEPLRVGRAIVATRAVWEQDLCEAIGSLGLPYHVILNKGSAMALPIGVDKATGFAAALAELGLSAGAVVGVGDAENDRTFLDLCGLAVAVAGALPEVKARADLVTEGDAGWGVVEVVERLLGGG